MILIPEDNTDDEDKCYLDGYSDSSKQLIKELLFNAYENEWQRTRDIEQKASSLIGFVGIIFTLTIASLLTIFVDADESTKDNILFSSAYSEIGIFLILLLMFLSILFGIRTIYLDSWGVLDAGKLLNYCREETQTENEFLEMTFDVYASNTADNNKTNNKLAKYLRISFIFFVVSLMSSIILTMFAINSFY